MNNISFKATFVDNIKIKTLDKNGNCIEKDASFVKKNPDSKLDYYSTVDIGDLWGDVRPNYVVSMLNYSNLMENDLEVDVYFLTEQMNNFRKIIPEQVLGMIEITKHKKHNTINFIQTRPDSTFKNQDRKTSGIGWAMLTMADKLSKGKDIILNARRVALKFYEKYGFIVVNDKLINPKMMLRRTKIHK